MWLIDEREPAIDRPWISAEQNADLILRLLDRLLYGDDFGLRLLHQKLSLVHVGDGALAALELDRVDSENLIVRRHRLLREFVLRIKLTQQVILRSDTADESCLHDISRKIGRQQLGTGRLRCATILSPEIQNVVERNTHRVKRRRAWIKRIALILDAHPAIQSWQLIGADNPYIRFGLQNARSRNADVVVVRSALPG